MSLEPDNCGNYIIQEPTTNSETLVSLDVYKQVAKERDIAIEQLHELGYEFGQKIKSTTKNDLAVDAISREDALMCLTGKFEIREYEPSELVSIFSKRIKALPPVTPQEPMVIPIAEVKFDEDKLKELVDRAVLTVIPQEPRWIPVSEKLPNDRDWYLGIFKEPDTGWINPLPFICDYVGRETKATTKEYWILRGFTDRDERIDYYFNLECVAWMPLPKQYGEEEE